MYDGVVDIIVLVILLGLIAWVVFYRGRKVEKFKKISPDLGNYMDTIPASEPFKDLASSEIDAFLEKYKRSFEACDRLEFDAMQAHMESCLKNLKEILDRLPNDAYVQRDTKVGVSNIESILRNHLEDVRTRCSFPALGLDATYEFQKATGMTAFND
jgi:hypothetical protein